MRSFLTIASSLAFTAATAVIPGSAPLKVVTRPLSSPDQTPKTHDVGHQASGAVAGYAAESVPFDFNGWAVPGSGGALAKADADGGHGRHGVTLSPTILTLKPNIGESSPDGSRVKGNSGNPAHADLGAAMFGGGSALPGSTGPGADEEKNPTFGTADEKLTSVLFPSGPDISITVTRNLNDIRQVDGNVTPIPEPVTWAMMLGGLALVGGALRRRRSITSTVTA